MLVLERTPGSAITIGPEIRIDILRTGINRVLIGIDAPRPLTIRRAELEPFGPDRPSPSNGHMTPRSVIEPGNLAPSSERARKFVVGVIGADPADRQSTTHCVHSLDGCDIINWARPEEAADALKCQGNSDPELLVIYTAQDLSAEIYAPLYQVFQRRVPFVVAAGKTPGTAAIELLHLGALAIINGDAKSTAFRTSLSALIAQLRHESPESQPPALPACT